jgi:hypothetical protein
MLHDDDDFDPDCSVSMSSSSSDISDILCDVDVLLSECIDLQEPFSDGFQQSANLPRLAYAVFVIGMCVASLIVSVGNGSYGRRPRIQADEMILFVSASNLCDRLGIQT